MLICYLFVFFCEVSIKIFGTFKKCVFLLLSSKSSLFVLDNSTLSDASFANIFLQPVACLLILSHCLLKKFFFFFNYNEVQFINWILLAF